MKLSQWNYQEFQELFAIPSRNGITISKSDRGAGVPLVNMSELFAMGRVRLNSEMEQVPLAEKDWDTWLLKKGDLMFGRRSLTYDGAGKCSIFMENEKATFESSLIRVRLDEAKADPRFYYYLFKSKYGKALMGQIVEQVAVAGIRSSDLQTLEVPVPPIETQRRIGHFLEILDEYVEASSAFEESVRELSRTKFEVIAMKSSKQTTFESLVDINPDRALKADDRLITFLEIGDVGNGNINWPDKVKWNEAPTAARNLVKKGDVIWSRVRPNRRSHAYLNHEVEDVVVTTGMVVIRPKNTIPSSLINAISDSEYFARQLTTLSDGTAYPTVDEDAFRNLVIPELSGEEVEEFNREISPLWDYISEVQTTAKAINSVCEELLMPLFLDNLRVAS